jgi:hypothetical protein
MEEGEGDREEGCPPMILEITRDFSLIPGDPPAPETFRVLYDDRDMDFVTSHKWIWMHCYIQCLTPGPFEFVSMHRAICAQAGMIPAAGPRRVVHHVNGSTLDNRRMNLHVLSHASHRRAHRGTANPYGPSRYLRLYRQFRSAVFGGADIEEQRRLSRELKTIRDAIREPLGD